jgi:hypothetical protein
MPMDTKVAACDPIEQNRVHKDAPICSTLLFFRANSFKTDSF